MLSSLLKTATILPSALFYVLNPAYGYERPTHVNITQQAIGQANNYSAFISNFHFNGIESIKKGSDHEDDGFLTLSRSRHHFYDPTNGLGLVAPFPVCIFTCKPSLEWGFNDTNNEYSWTKAREYMCIGLTGINFDEVMVAPTADQRNEYIQKMFRSVGQVMHLVQDLAVPAHVRNDLHLPVGLAGDLYEKFTANPNNFSPTWLNGYSTVKLSQFVDFWNSSQGLAVFTNHNFISQDTNFDNFNFSGQLYYPSPQINGIVTETENVTNQFGVPISVQVDYGRNVIQDAYTGDVINNDRLTAFSVFDFEAQEILGERVYSVNDFTAQSAANILVRRAVGYSAGLLDYFFRGRMVAQSDKWTATSQPDVKITNSSEEAMNGTFSLYYDDNKGQRKPAASWSDVMLAPGESKDGFTFSLPTDIREDGTYVLVFRGTLGAEADAVAGKVVHIQPPKPEYVFIIQDSVNFGTPRVADNSATIPGRSVSLQTIDSPDQFMEGRFVTFGEIQSIDAYYSYSDYQFFVNGRLMSGHSWKKGDTPDPPTTWKIQAIGEPERSYNCSDNSFPREGGAEIVAVVNRNIASIITPLWVYDRRNINYCSDQPGLLGVGAAYKYSKHDSSPNTIDNKAAVLSMALSGASMVPLVDQWKINQLGGFKPEDSYTRQDSGSNWSYYEFKGAGMSIYQQPFYSHLWNSVNYDPNEVNLSITGEFERQYGAQELEYLSSIGIEPIYYTVIAQ
jgi:hypothetical protein